MQLFRWAVARREFPLLHNIVVPFVDVGVVSNDIVGVVMAIIF